MRSMIGRGRTHVAGTIRLILSQGPSVHGWNGTKRYGSTRVGSVQFRVLGPVAVTTTNGAPLPLGPAKRRSLLAMLLAHPNTPVGVERLTEALWDEEPPRHARTVLQGHVSRLRAVFAQHDAEAHGVELLTQGAAYRLRLPEALVDAHRFEESLRLVRRSADPAEAVAVLREALGLWQGPAFAGTVHSAPLEAPAHALEELRLTAVEALARAYGQLGDHGAAASVLRAEATAHPLREPLVAQLMLVLARAGRQADALDWFHRTRKLLADEIGVDPAPVLTDAYRTLLRADTDAGVDTDTGLDTAAQTPADADADVDNETAAGSPTAWPHEAAVAAGPVGTPNSCPAGPGASSRDRRNSPSSTASRARCRAPSSRSRALPASARPRSPCTGRTDGAPTSPTAPSSPTCAASAPLRPVTPAPCSASSCSRSASRSSGCRARPPPSGPATVN